MIEGNIKMVCGMRLRELVTKFLRHVVQISGKTIDKMIYSRYR